jgi:hypothetical protein
MKFIFFNIIFNLNEKIIIVMIYYNLFCFQEGKKLYNFPVIIYLIKG